MASNINPFNIDGAYPVAGQDNDSQGFRDNFTSIRNNLAVTKAEIEDLQAKAVLKSALTGSNLDNNLAGSVLAAPQLRGYSESLVDHSFLQGILSLDYNSANIHKVTTTGSITLQFTTTWPAAGLYGRMFLWINVANTAHTLTLPITSPGVTGGLQNISGSTSGSGVITFDQTGDYIFSFVTVDAGQNIYVQDVTRNNKYFQDPSFYYNPTVNSTVMVGYSSALTSGLTNETGQNKISALGSYNTVTVANLTQANVSDRVTDTGILGGYSITAARGNLALASKTGVNSNDMLGFVNSVAFTGINNNSSNVFQQTASIGFYSTGSNAAYGLGGNMAFFTAPDGQNNVSSVRQVVGIENDLGARVFGNLILSATTTATSSAFKPATNSDPGGVPGQIAWEKNGSNYYLYICFAAGVWGRVGPISASW